MSVCIFIAYREEEEILKQSQIHFLWFAVWQMNRINSIFIFLFNCRVYFPGGYHALREPTFGLFVDCPWDRIPPRKYFSSGYHDIMIGNDITLIVHHFSLVEQPWTAILTSRQSTHYPKFIPAIIFNFRINLIWMLINYPSMDPLSVQLNFQGRGFLSWTRPSIIQNVCLTAARKRGAHVIHILFSCLRQWRHLMDVHRKSLKLIDWADLDRNLRHC